MESIVCLCVLNIVVVIIDDDDERKRRYLAFLDILHRSGVLC